VDSVLVTNSVPLLVMVVSNVVTKVVDSVNVVVVGSVTVSGV